MAHWRTKGVPSAALPLCTKGLEISSTRELEAPSRPMAVDPINHWLEQGPGGGGVQPTQAHQPVGLPEGRHVDDDAAISPNRVDSAHGRAVADPPMGGGVVVRRIDVDKTNPAVALIPAAQGFDLPLAKGAGSIKKERECGIGHGPSLEITRGQPFLGLVPHRLTQGSWLEPTPATLQAALTVPLPVLWSQLAQRQLRPEVMDQPGLDPRDHQAALLGLARINGLTRTASCFSPAIRRLARLNPSRRLRILDVACGGGDTVRAICRLGRREGLDLEVHGCDLSGEAVALASAAAQGEGIEAHFFQADAIAAPLPDGYHLITSSLFLHHLKESDAETLLRSMAAATLDQLLVHDLLRSHLDLLLTWIGTRLLSRSAIVHIDGPLSVGGAFQLDEVAHLAAAAGLTGAQISRFWPERFLLSWSRNAPRP